jgi:drug/metabolite transporter (DMT)-like permease
LSQARTTITFLVLAPLLFLRRGSAAFTLPRRDLVQSFLIGVVGMAFCNYSYYFAIQRTNVATAITLQYTAPILVLLYMLMRRKQRPTVRRVGSVFLAVLGIAVALGLVGPAHFRLDLKGVVAAEIAAATFAYYNIGSSTLLQRHDRWRLLLWAQFAAALWWNIVNPPWRVFAARYNLTEWLFLVTFALLSALIPSALYLGGLRHLDATRAIVTSCLEPVFSIGLAALALSEGVAVLQMFGIAIVLIATVVVQLPEKQQEPEPILVEPVD